jgi:enolase
VTRDPGRGARSGEGARGEVVAASVTAVHAREILDCRGYPTLRVDVWSGGAPGAPGAVQGRADVPAGRSTGAHEARELRDGDPARYRGSGVTRAAANVNDVIAPRVLGLDVLDQKELDRTLCELDGTPDKRRLGANAIVGVSLAAARCAAASRGLPLHRALNDASRVLPVPLINLLGGGRLTSNDLAFQEFIMMPVGAASFAEAIRMASECHMALQEIVVARYGKLAANTGDEGDFATPIVDVREALSVVREGVAAAGYRDEAVYALDCAAAHLWDERTHTYAVGGRRLTTAEMIELYRELVRDYGVASIEDPLDEEDWEGWAALTRALPDTQLVGDDLFVTDAERVRKGIALGAGNALLWKVNQIGTLTEAVEAASVARDGGFGVCVSERSGETEDPLIADLVVALGAGQIKTGSPVRGERTAKYNRLLEIEEWLGDEAVYPGRAFRRPPGTAFTG